MINTDVPGELTPEELQALVLVATLVPEGGTIVEVGSYLGLSAWHWAKNTPGNVTVYCHDPWDGYRGSSLEKFKANVADCEGIVPCPGYSPRDFAAWDRPIDLYFEDAVHKNPVLGENIAFWGSFLKPEGIYCGHDYIDKFPDVMEAARALARKAGTQLHVVRSFWCVLPPTTDSARQHQFDECTAKLAKITGYRQVELNVTAQDLVLEVRRARVAQISSFQYDMVIERPRQGTVHSKGGDLSCTGKVTNISGVDWPVVIDGQTCLAVGLELHHKKTQRKIASARVALPGSEFRAGETHGFSVKFPLSPQIMTGPCELRVDLVYDYVSWFARKGAKNVNLEVHIAPEMNFDTPDPALPLNDRRSWKQYVPEYNPCSPMGIDTTAFQEYTVTNPSGVQQVRSMLSIYEIALLYALARNYTGMGEILDLGPLTGLTTNALARGLLHNTRDIRKRKRIFSYDLFLMDGMEHFLDRSDGGGTGSLFWRYLELNRDFLDAIVPVPGDILKLSWTGEPIEIMFIDLCKSLDVNRHLLQNFFPCLIPRESIVIQQDYAHVDEYWISLTMEHLADYFEPLHFIFGATAAFRLKEPIPKELLAEDITSLPLDRCEYYFDRAMEKASTTVREVLRCCKAANYLRFKSYDQARACLAEVDFAAREAGMDPTADFSGLIARQARVVDSWLRRACGVGSLCDSK